MLVFMPKYKHYTAIPPKMLHDVTLNINTAIKNFMLQDDTVEVFIEDEFALNNFNNKKVFTCTRASELKALYNYEAYDEHIHTIEVMHPYATKYTLEFKKMQLPEYKLLYTDINAYKKQYIKLYFQRACDCVQTLLKEEKKFALVFTYRGKNDNPIVPKSEENDGILYIYCDLETGVISGRYSGIWVDTDIIKTILGGIYGINNKKIRN